MMRPFLRTLPLSITVTGTATGTTAKATSRLSSVVRGGGVRRMMLLPTVIVRNFVALPLQNDVVEVMNTNRNTNTNTAGDGVGDNCDGDRDRARNRVTLYTRVVYPDINDFEIDEELIQDLIVDRDQARFREEYDEADQLYTTLLFDYGVIVNDTTQTWQTGTRKELKKTKKRIKTTEQQKQRQRLQTRMLNTYNTSTAPAAAATSSSSRNIENENQIRSRRRSFDDTMTTPYSYYTYCKTAGPPIMSRTTTSTSSSTMGTFFSEEETILSQLQQRQHAQQRKDYASADIIRTHLKKQYGVYVDDRLREWRADGVPFYAHTHTHAHNNVDEKEKAITESDNEIMKQNTKSRSNTCKYTTLVRSKYSLPLEHEHNEGDDDDDNANEQQTHDHRLGLIEHMLKERAMAKSNRTYETADRIKNILYETYNIRLDDKLGEWSVGGIFFANDDISSQYKKHWSYHSIPSSASSSSLASMNSRTTARSSSNASKRPKKQYIQAYTRSSYSKQLPTNNGKNLELYIHQKVNERMRAKRTQNYTVSDTIRDELYTNYNVTIHDKINQWSVGGKFGNEYMPWTNTTTRTRGDGSGAGRQRSRKSTGGGDSSFPRQRKKSNYDRR